MPLGREVQLDFSAGSQLDVAPHLIDPRGFYRAGNTLLDDDGSGYKRGGSQKAADAAFDDSLRGVWSGWLAPGRRTLVASTENFGVLAADDKTIVDLGGAGFPTIPREPRAFQDLLFIPGGTIYGGSRKAADYSTGKVKFTKASAVVEGAGTAFEANVDAGMLLRVAGERVYVVAKVVSDTKLELRDAYEGATAEVAYTLKRLETATAPYVTSDIYAVAGQRLFACADNVVRFSEIDKPHLWEATIPPEMAVVQNEHDLEEGVRILTAEAVGLDKVLIGHTRGVTAISNLARSIVDGQGNSQHRIDLLTGDLISWGGTAGIATYRGAVVLPARDNVYLIDGVSQPVPIGTALGPYQAELVEAGYTPGGAWVEQGHYFLPILDVTGTPVDLLCCRLDRPLQIRGELVFPWTFQDGAGAKIAAGAPRQVASAGDDLVVYGACDDGFLLDLSGYFNPRAAVKHDHDGTTPLWSLVSRDIGTGDLAIARARRFVIFYELEADGEEEPLITAEVGRGVRKSGLPVWDEVTWDDFEWSLASEDEFTLLEGGAPPNIGGENAELSQNAWEWPMNERARYTRYRLQCADPVAKLTLRGFEVFLAQPGGVRLTKVV